MAEFDGEPFTLEWDRQTVMLEGLERALYVLADQLTATIEQRGGSWVTQLHPRGPHADRAALAHRLRQEVNDQVLRVRIAQRTDSLRSLVFALAFSRSGLVESTEK